VAIATLVTTAGAEVLAESLNKVDAIGDRILFYLLPDLLPEDDERSDLTETDVADLNDAGWQIRRLD